MNFSSYTIPDELTDPAVEYIDLDNPKSVRNAVLNIKLSRLAKSRLVLLFAALGMLGTAVGFCALCVAFSRSYINF